MKAGLFKHNPLRCRMTVLLSAGPNTQIFLETKSKLLVHRISEAGHKKSCLRIHLEKVLPQKNKPTILHNINPTFSSPQCANTDYKITHRRIFTVILHQIIKNVYGRDCTICRGKEEDLEHLFSTVRLYPLQVNDLLEIHCGLRITEQKD